MVRTRSTANAPTRTTPFVAATLGALLVLSACGEDGATSGAPASTTDGAATTPAPVSSASATDPTAPNEPTAAVAEAPVSPDTTAPPDQDGRVFLVGDSTLLAVEAFNAVRGFRGFSGTLDTASCRTLGIPSCGPEPVPPNTVEAIEAAEGPFEIVVVMAGYDEWWTSFPDSMLEVAEAARDQGATTLLMLNYREGVGYVAPDGRTATEAFVRNNETLRELEASGEIPELVVADWYGYTSVPETDGWLSRDGIHLTQQGAWGVTDYISRWVANLQDEPCPDDESDDAPVCENPDESGIVPDELIPPLD